MEITRLFLCPDIWKNPKKYPVMGREGSEIYAICRRGKILFSAGNNADTRRRYTVVGVIHNTSKQRLWIAMRQPEGSLLGEKSPNTPFRQSREVPAKSREERRGAVWWHF